MTPALDYDTAVARHHAALLAHLRRIGNPRGAHDLIIAATARATDRLLVTIDAKAGFDELPDVRARLQQRTGRNERSAPVKPLLVSAITNG